MHTYQAGQASGSRFAASHAIDVAMTTAGPERIRIKDEKHAKMSWERGKEIWMFLVDAFVGKWPDTRLGF